MATANGFHKTTAFDVAPDALPGLLPMHLAELRASGLNDETIIAAGIYSETEYPKLASILNWSKYPAKYGSGLVFPYFDSSGEKVLRRVKLSNPRKCQGNPVKYEHPKGAAPRAYIPPSVRAALETKGQRLVIVEGEKKTLALVQAGIPAIGLAGVTAWNEAKTARLLPDLERIDWSGREVLLCFDSDAVRKPAVASEECKLAAVLGQRSATVRVVRLPDGPPSEDGKPTKQGVDDFLVARSVPELWKLIEVAGPAELPNVDDMLLPAKHMEPAEEVRRYLEICRLDRVYRLRFWRGAFCLWQRGRYVELKTSEVRAHVVNHLNRRYSFLSMTVLNNVIMQLQAQSLLPGTVEPPAWLGDDQPTWPAHEMLAAKNGLVHLPSLAENNPHHLMPPTPRYFSPVVLDYEFRLDAPKPEAWFRFLHSLWPKDQRCIDLLQEWFGLTLTLDTSFQKILMLIGPKRSGKGTIARVQQDMIGKANCAGPTLAGMATNFGLWPLLGKQLAIISDARLGTKVDQSIVVERLLSISGEDSLTIDRKMLEPVTCKLPTRLMIVSNELPKLGDASGAITSRMLLLPLAESFYGREDRGLTMKLSKELPGILLWAIAGWKRLTARGHFLQPEAGEELLSDLADLASPISVFVRERCVVEPSLRVTVSDLFDEWKSWSEERGWKSAGTEQTFGRDLRAALQCVRVVRPKDGGERYRAYQGIGLKSGFGST